MLNLKAVNHNREQVCSSKGDTAMLIKSISMPDIGYFKNDPETGKSFNDFRYYDDADDNQFLGGTRHSKVYAGGGNDRFLLQANDDWANGEAGNDYFDGGSGNDTIYGGADDDDLRGSLDSDYLYGGTGNDTLYAMGSVLVSLDPDPRDGDSSANYLSGDEGNDKLYGSEGRDEMSGGTGNDYLDGWRNDDTLYGGENNDTLYGGEGNDYIDGGSGFDYLHGGSGDDTLVGGGAGDKIYVVDSTRDMIINTPRTGIETVLSFVTWDLRRKNPFSITEETGLDHLTLGGSDAINGTGNDLNNTISGNNAKNLLYGNKGNDRLYGRDGDDFLVGGMGNDTLTGGAGKDRFVYHSKNEGVDRIMDFSVVDDVINVSKTGFGAGLNVGTLQANQFTIGSSATLGSHRFIYEKTTGKLFFDADGSGAGGKTQIGTLSANLGMTNNDIFVIG